MSNSRSSLKFETPKAEAGIDTWSAAWYLRDDSGPARACKALMTDKVPRGFALPEWVMGHRVGWFPGQNLVWVEGHPSQEGLGHPSQLPHVVDRLREDLVDRGLLLPSHRYIPVKGGDGSIRPALGDSGFAGVRRLDSTVNLAFEDPLQGLAALAGAAALPMPRHKTQIMRETGGRRIETVYYRGMAGKRVLARFYDKGVESGSAPRGTFLRPEDQRRFTKTTRPTLEALASGTYVRDSFVQRFQPLWSASKGIKVAGVITIAREVAKLRDEGELTDARARSVIGHIVLDHAECDNGSRATQYRYRALIRDLGLVLADGVLDEVEVNLADVLEQAMDHNLWQG